MCGRFTLRTPAPVLIRQFGLATMPVQPVRYNIAPSQSIVAVRQTDVASPAEAVMLRWGLIPAWAEDPRIGNRLINARGETVAVKPSFRHAFARRRCLIAADGFYEWKKRGVHKQPYFITLADGEPFAMAGLWERWSAPHQAPLDTCTIITTEPNPLMQEIHDRMPVILARGDYSRWLDPSLHEIDALAPLLVPYPSDAMQALPVGQHVNDPRHDDARCVEHQQMLFD